MYRVTGYFRDNKVTRSFTDLYDAIDFRDIVDAHYPLSVTFEKVIDMREFVYNSWNVVMDHEKNPLSVIPDFSTRHMIMQILAWMWCIVFGIIVGSMYAGVFSMVMHTLILGALAITVGTFETAKRRPQYFGGFGRGAGGEHE
ncbi:MAG TPA: hypothetical protein DCM04_02590 [Saprospirales bacterium]|nr:hypothetical protein [Saprospirales bacterium]|tara:strand:- start:31367 stop:31795 length:429 start_codon:yes stop_codon:yes gene_type:complete